MQTVHPLDTYLRAHGISRLAFAERIGCSPSRLTQIINRGDKPGPALLEAIARETGNVVTPNHIFAISPADAQSIAVDGEPVTAQIDGVCT